VTAGGGWTKIHFIQGKNGAGSFDLSSYDLATAANYVRITGVVNGQGDYIGGTTALPLANEYLFKAKIVSRGGNSCRGSIVLRPGSAGSHYQHTPGGQKGSMFSDMVAGDEVVTHFSRSANAVRTWSTRSATINGLTPTDLANVLSTPADTGSVRGPGTFGAGTTEDVFYFSCLFTDFSPIPSYDLEAWMR